MQFAIVKDDKVYCPNCKSNNFKTMDVDLLQGVEKDSKCFVMYKRCLGCGDKSKIYKRNFTLESNGEYFIDDEENWLKIKEERKEFKDE